MNNREDDREANCQALKTIHNVLLYTFYVKLHCWTTK